MNRLHTLAAVLLLALGGVSAAADVQARIATATADAHADDRPVASAAAAASPAVAVTGEAVTYGRDGDREFRGYFARPAAGGDGLPGLIVIHEWWGLNDNIRAMTDRLAGEGYAALAVDLYGGESAATPKEAMALMNTLNSNDERAERNLRSAYEYLLTDRGAPRIGVIGWCLGGRWSLKTALYLPGRLDAMVMYYGSVVTDEARLATLEMPIMGNFAADDPIIPAESVRAFESTLTGLGKEADIKIYAGAKHAFANPSGMAYNKAAARDAWLRSTRFLARHLQDR